VVCTDEKTFRHLCGYIASRVTVIITRDGAVDVGAKAFAVPSLALELEQRCCIITRFASPHERLRCNPAGQVVLRLAAKRRAARSFLDLLGQGRRVSHSRPPRNCPPQRRPAAPAHHTLDI